MVDGEGAGAASRAEPPTAGEPGHEHPPAEELLGARVLEAGTSASSEAPPAEELLRARVLEASVSRATEPPARARLTPATLVALLLLVVSAGASLTYVLAYGGVALPSLAPRSPLAAATARVSVMPSPGPPVAAATPTEVPVSASPTVPPTAAPTAGVTLAPSPTSDRYALLVPCPDRPDCYIYTVRAGNNLYSIARYYGIPLETIYQLNTTLRTTTLRPGMQVIIPTPTR